MAGNIKRRNKMGKNEVLDCFIESLENENFFRLCDKVFNRINCEKDLDGFDDYFFNKFFNMKINATTRFCPVGYNLLEKVFYTCNWLVVLIKSDLYDDFDCLINRFYELDGFGEIDYSCHFDGDKVDFGADDLLNQFIEYFFSKI